MNIKILSLFILMFGMWLLAGCSDDPAPPPPVTLSSISISPTSVPDGLPVDLTQQFTATGSYSDGSVQDLSSSVTWDSSVPATASIDGNGLATGQAVGTADITASDSGLTSNSVALEVVNPTLVSLSVAPATVPIALDAGRTLQFQAEGLFNNNKTYDVTGNVTWNSDDTAVATIDTSGLVTAEPAGAPGTANISASTAAPAVTSNIVALTTEVKTQTSLTIEPQNPVALPVGRRQPLVALLRADDDSVQNVTDTVVWIQSKASVADVNSEGVVFANSVGTSTITATDTATGLQDSVDIEVNDATIDTVTIFPQNPADLPAGHTKAFSAVGTFSDGVTRIMRGVGTWSVSDRSFALIVPVEENVGGLARVTGLAVGDVDVIYTDILTGGTATGKQDSAPLTVSAATLNSINLSPNTTQTLAAESSVQFWAFGNYSDSSIVDITNDVNWVSSDTTVGVFDIESRGKLDILPGAAEPDETDVTASMLDANDILITSAPVTADVIDATLQSLNIVGSFRVRLGAAAQYTANGTLNTNDVEDYTQRVTWRSSDPGIATVSNAEGTKGLVTPVGLGTITILAVDPATSINDAKTIEIIP